MRPFFCKKLFSIRKKLLSYVGVNIPSLPLLLWVSILWGKSLLLWGQIDAGKSLFFQRKFTESQLFFHQFLTKNASPIHHSEALFWVGRCQEQQAMYDSAAVRYGILSSARYPDYWRGMAYAGLTSCYSFLSDFAKANAYFDTLQSHLQKYPNDDLYIYRAFHAYYYCQSNYPKALEYSLKGVRMGEKQPKDPMLAVAYLNLGNAYQMLEEWNKALYYYQKSENLHYKLNIQLALPLCYQVLGILNAEQKNHREAIKYYTKSLELDKASGNEYGQAYNQMSIAASELFFKNYAVSKALLKEAIPVLQKYKDEQALAYSSNLMGEILNSEGKYKEAIAYFLKAKQKNLIIKYDEGVKESLTGLKDAYKSTKQWDKVAESLAELMAVKDSVNNAEKVKIIQNLTLKYETEKKDAQLAEQQLEIVQKRQQITQIALLASVLLLALGVGFGAYRWYQRRRIRQMESGFEATYQQLKSFNYSVSHDFRAPLLQALDILKQMQTQSVVAQADVGRVRQLNERMNEMLKAMTRLAQLEQEFLRLSPVQIDLLMTEVVEETKENYPAYTQRSTFITTGMEITANADRMLLKEALANLVGNAAKYSHQQPSPTITVASKTTASQLVITITDNGVGFNPADAPKLFQPFVRLHHQNEYEGTGLGLVIVKNIIEKHGGTINLNSRPNEGTTCTILLPNFPKTD